MLIDSHAHLNFKAYNKDRPDVIKRCLQNRMKVINVGSQLPTSQAAVEIADQYRGNMYAAVGFHPTHSEDLAFDVDDFQKLIINNKGLIYAVGEIGLDYYHINEESPEYKEQIKLHQKEIFQLQCNLASSVKLPVILHCRDAYDDLINECRKNSGQHNGVVHCYLGDTKTADQFLELGYLLGFTGIITFSDNAELMQVIKMAPIEKILIETDSPYLTPVPFRGKRNEPMYVQYVAEKIARIKDMNKEEVIEQTGENAINLFKLK